MEIFDLRITHCESLAFRGVGVGCGDAGRSPGGYEGTDFVRSLNAPEWPCDACCLRRTQPPLDKSYTPPQRFDSVSSRLYSLYDISVVLHASLAMKILFHIELVRFFKPMSHTQNMHHQRSVHNINLSLPTPFSTAGSYSSKLEMICG